MKRSGLVKSATLTRITTGSRSTQTGGTAPTATTYRVRGWVTTTRKTAIGGTLVEAGDRVVAILGASVTVTPAVNDKLTIKDVQQNVVGVDFDPAEAIYIVLTRG